MRLVLYPPLDEDTRRNLETTDGEKQRPNPRPSGSRQRLRERPNSSSRGESTDLSVPDSLARRQRLASNFETLKKRKRENAEVTPHHIQLATETANLAAVEIARMNRAIAELECLLRPGSVDS